MPNFNNCKVAIQLKNNSTAKYSKPILIKDASDTAVILTNSSILEHSGISGSTGSSFNIHNCKRGIQLQNSSRLDVENANITRTQYGFVGLNASSFDFNKSSINADTFSSFTGQAYGMFISDNTIGNIFQSSITGYAGGTASLTSGNIATVKNGTLFVGTTADRNLVNTTTLGSSLVGQVFVDPTFGQKIIGNDSVASAVADNPL